MRKLGVVLSVVLCSSLMFLVSCLKPDGNSSEVASVEFTKPDIEGVTGAELNVRPSENKNSNSECTKHATATFGDTTKVSEEGLSLTLDKECFAYNFELTYTCGGKECYHGTENNVPFDRSEKGNLYVEIKMTKTDGAPGGAPSTYTATSTTVTKTTVQGKIEESSKVASFVTGCTKINSNTQGSVWYKCSTLQKPASNSGCTQDTKATGSVSLATESSANVMTVGNNTIFYKTSSNKVEKYVCN